jgi:hypothetical protein
MAGRANAVEVGVDAVSEELDVAAIPNGLLRVPGNPRKLRDGARGVERERLEQRVQRWGLGPFDVRVGNLDLAVQVWLCRSSPSARLALSAVAILLRASSVRRLGVLNLCFLLSRNGAGELPGAGSVSGQSAAGTIGTNKTEASSSTMKPAGAFV